ncbi:retrotransposon protein, putative, unclassified [Tanacetum coccineum]
MTPENKEHFLSEKEAIFLLLTSIGDEIYSTVDACKTANEMWIAIERLQQGESLETCTRCKDQFCSGNLGSLLLEMENQWSRITPCISKGSTNLPTTTSTSSNPGNKGRKIPHQGYNNDNQSYNNDNQSGQFGNQRTMTVVGAKETVGSQAVQQNRIYCFNCKGFGHYAKECRKPKRVKDYSYHKENMMMCKQAEHGVSLQFHGKDSGVLPEESVQLKAIGTGRQNHDENNVLLMKDDIMATDKSISSSTEQPLEQIFLIKDMLETLMVGINDALRLVQVVSLDLESEYNYTQFQFIARTLSIGMTYHSIPRSLLTHQGVLEQVYYITYPSRFEMPPLVHHPKHTSCSSESKWDFLILNSFNLAGIYMNAITVNHMPKELIHILKESSFFLTNNTSAPHGDELGRIKPLSWSSLSWFDNSSISVAARTMLSASKLPLSFWAEAVATACYTQNRSIIISTHGKTAYHIINDRKPSIKHLHIFGCICYITRDGENLDKMKEKGDLEGISCLQQENTLNS